MVEISFPEEPWFCLVCLTTIPANSLQVHEETEMGVKLYCETCAPEEHEATIEEHLAAGPPKRKRPESKNEEADAPPSKIANLSGGGMTIEKYTEHSLVLRGETNEHKESLKVLGLKYNRNLKVGGPGWIFPKALLPSVEAFLADPSALPTALPSALPSATPSDAPPSGDSGLTVEKYSEQSFVVRGNTMPFKDALKSLGGSFNPKLKQGGPGWIFPASLRPKIDSFLANPSAPLPVPPAPAASSSSSSIYVEPLSDKAFIVKGDTKPVKDKLSSMGGKWSGLQKGWTFSNSQLEQVNGWIASLANGSSPAPVPASGPASGGSASGPSSGGPASGGPVAASGVLVASASGSVTCESYSEKALVVRGDTKPLKPALTAIGCKWNGSLKGGCGWIVSKSKQTQVEELVRNAT